MLAARLLDSHQWRSRIRTRSDCDGLVDRLAEGVDEREQDVDGHLTGPPEVEVARPERA